MTPKPPAPSEGSSLPPRVRPNLDDLIKDSAESDLWALDDLDQPDEGNPKPPSPAIQVNLPEPRGIRKKKPLELNPPRSAAPNNGVQVNVGAMPACPWLAGLAATNNSVQMNVGKEPSITPLSSVPSPSRPGAEFDDLDDLDHWDESAQPVLSIHPSLIPPPVDEVNTSDEAGAQATSAVTPATTADTSDELSPVAPANATPVALVPRLGLSRVERIGLWALCAILLIGGVMVFFNTVNRLPTGAERLKAGDFPVKGRHVTILSADTFWRPPITEGSNPETVRRGTQLLPVINLTSSGGPAAVRFFFRDQDGLVMGDAVTRTLKPGIPLQVAATAGFEDVGMHAAYRTGQTKPWTIEVLEAPSETADNSDFRKLFDINISTDRR